MSSGQCCGDKYSPVGGRGRDCGDGPVGLFRGGQADGKARMAFEQKPEGGERVPYGYWGKYILDRGQQGPGPSEGSILSILSLAL